MFQVKGLDQLLAHPQVNKMVGGLLLLPGGKTEVEVDATVTLDSPGTVFDGKVRVKCSVYRENSVYGVKVKGVEAIKVSDPLTAEQRAEVDAVLGADKPA